MKFGSGTLVRCGAAACALAVTALVACESTWTFKGEGEVVGARGTASVTYDGRDKKVSVTNDAGIPMDIGFLDENGNQIGPLRSMESGTTVTAPTGMTNVVIKVPSTAPPAEGDWADVVAQGGRWAGRTDRVVKGARIDYRITTFSLVPALEGGGSLANLTADFEIAGTPEMSFDELWNRVLPVILGGPGTPLPASVRVNSFVRFVPEEGGGRLLASKVGEFEEFSLEWNQQPMYASLANQTNVSVHSDAHAWQTCEVFVPTADFAPPLELNQLEIDLRTSSDQVPMRVTGSLQYFL